MKTANIILIVVIIIIAFALGWYLSGTQAPKEDEVLEPVSDEEVAEEMRPGWVKYESSELGLSFEYPQEYGDVVVNLKQRPETGEPYSETFPDNYPSGIDRNLGGVIKLIYFRGSFTNNVNFTFGGGHDCIGCEPALIDTGEWFFQDPEQYQKISSDDGRLGLLKLGEPLPDPDCFYCIQENQFMASFLLDNDYRAISFIGEDSQINRDILVTLRFD